MRCNYAAGVGFKDLVKMMEALEVFPDGIYDSLVTRGMCDEYAVLAGAQEVLLHILYIFQNVLAVASAIFLLGMHRAVRYGDAGVKL